MLSVPVNTGTSLPNSKKQVSKSLIYYYQAGVEAENYGLSIIYQSLKNDKTCIFVTSSTVPSVIKNQFRESGLPYSRQTLDKMQNGLFNPVISISGISGNPLQGHKSLLLGSICN